MTVAFFWRQVTRFDLAYNIVISIVIKKDDIRGNVRVGYGLDFRDSDSNFAYLFRFLTILDYDSLRGGMKTDHMLKSQIVNCLFCGSYPIMYWLDFCELILYQWSTRAAH